MTDIDRFIERLALEIANHPKQIAWDVRGATREVLKRELRPVLDAGQKIAELGSWNTSSSTEIWFAAIKKLAEESGK